MTGSFLKDLIQDSTMLVQMEEVMCVIRVMSFVTKLSPLGTYNRHGQGWQVSLPCFRCRKFNSCGKIMSDVMNLLVSKIPLMTKQQFTVSPDTPNVLEEIIHLDQVKTRTITTNKVALESEKKRDDAEKIVEELKRQM